MKDQKYVNAKKTKSNITTIAKYFSKTKNNNTTDINIVCWCNRSTPVETDERERLQNAHRKIKRSTKKTKQKTATTNSTSLVFDLPPC